MWRHERRGWQWRMVVGSTTAFAYVLARSRGQTQPTRLRHTTTRLSGATAIANPVGRAPIGRETPDAQCFRPGRRSGYVDPDWDPAAGSVRTASSSARRMGAYTDITDQPWRRVILALLLLGVFAVGIAFAMRTQAIELPGSTPDTAEVADSPPTAVPEPTADTRFLGHARHEQIAPGAASVSAQEAPTVIRRFEPPFVDDTLVVPTPLLHAPVAVRSQFIDWLNRSEREAYARAGGLPDRAMSALPFRGMGYQPTYVFSGVPTADRKERLEVDFRRMAEVGVNLVNGWDDGIFDETLLDAAAANHMFVIMPLDVPKGRDYSDPEVRALTKAYVAERVARYRNRDPIVMWGPGVEVTLDMTPEQQHVFARFMLELHDTIRAIDPTRPVIIREAEDVFAPFVADAIALRQGIDVPQSRVIANDAHDQTQIAHTIVRAPVGLIYGVHFYTERLGPALKNWIPDQGLDIPLMVTEYAPAGVGRALRAEGFKHMYELIQSGGPRVLGSTPYTWSTDGPEAVDRYFGLVDPEGRPIDAALETITSFYGVDPPEWVRNALEDHDVALASEVPRLLEEAVVVAARRSAISEAQIRAFAAQRVASIGEEIGLNETDVDPGALRAREVIALIGYARILSEQWEANGTRRMFPGMYEALPLLSGMARWSRGEASATDTARGFMASVLRRDLAVLIAS